MYRGMDEEETYIAGDKLCIDLVFWKPLAKFKSSLMATSIEDPLFPDPLFLRRQLEGNLIRERPVQSEEGEAGREAHNGHRVVPVGLQPVECSMYH